MTVCLPSTVCDGCLCCVFVFVYPETSQTQTPRNEPISLFLMPRFIPVRNTPCDVLPRFSVFFSCRLQCITTPFHLCYISQVNPLNLTTPGTASPSNTTTPEIVNQSNVTPGTVNSSNNCTTIGNLSHMTTITTTTRIVNQSNRNISHS